MPLTVPWSRLPRPHMPPAVRERLSGRSVLPPRAALVLCPVKAAAQLCVRTKAIRDVRGRKTWPSSSCFQFGDAWCCGGACRWVGAVLRRCLPRRRRRRHRRRRRPSLVPSRVVHKANTALRALLGPSPAQVRVDDLPGRLIGGCSAAWRASISLVSTKQPNLNFPRFSSCVFLPLHQNF